MMASEMLALALLAYAAFALPGCYEDAADARLLAHTVCDKTGGCTALTLEYCAAACRALKYGIAGVEAGHACFCDHAVPAGATSTPDAECNATCSGTTSPGQTKERCGGDLRLWAYNATTTPLPAPPVPPSAFPDARDVTQAQIVFEAGYVDQTYCASNYPSAWTCVLTASLGGEGSSGEQCYATSTSDDGASWTNVTTIEAGIASGGYPNAYATVVAEETSGRVHAIYNVNSENKTAPGRNDLMGGFFRRYSDDDGATWSDQRYAVPTRATAVDRENTFKGDTQMLWTVDQIKTGPFGVGFAFTKIGGYVENPPEEVFIMFSPNLLTEPDQDEVTWEMVPSGDHGIVPPPQFDNKTTVIEEPKLLPLANGTGFTILTRSNRGLLFEATTRDDTGRSGWRPTTLARYADPLDPSKPLGDFGAFVTSVKSSRAPFTAKRIPGTDRFLLLFYNSHVDGVRNPYWLSAGREAPDGSLLWSQPEVAIFDRSYQTTGTAAGGYPDFLFADGAVKVALAQKGMPTHVSTFFLVDLDPALVAGLLAQESAAGEPDADRLAVNGTSGSFPAVAWPDLRNVSEPRQGFALSFKVAGHNASKDGDLLLSDAAVQLVVGTNGAPRLLVKGAGGAALDFTADRACAAKLSKPGPHAVTVVADAGPRLAFVVVDGALCDGGGVVGKGWTWLPAPLAAMVPGGTVAVGATYAGTILEARAYARALATSEVVGQHRGWLL